MLHLAWSQVGRSEPPRDCVGQTTHGLKAAITVSSILTDAQDIRLQEKLEELANKEDASFTINRFHDATRMLCTFGALQGQVYRNARYLHKENGRWLALPLEDFLERRGYGKTMVPKFGCVEIFAQAVNICLATSDSEKMDKVHVVVKPRVVLDTKASTVFRACEVAVVPVDLQHLQQLAGRVKVGCVIETPDAISSNNRKKHAYAAQLPSNILYDWTRACAAHRVTRIIEAVSSDRFNGDVHAVSLVTGKPPIHAKAIRLLHDLVTEYNFAWGTTVE